MFKFLSFFIYSMKYATWKKKLRKVQKLNLKKPPIPGIKRTDERIGRCLYGISIEVINGKRTKRVKSLRKPLTNYYRQKRLGKGNL